MYVTHTPISSDFWVLTEAHVSFRSSARED